MHKAKVMGRVERKVYEFRWRYFNMPPHVNSKKEFIEHEEFWSGELENPPLEVGDSLFIEDKSIRVDILHKAKSTDGGFVYWTDYVIDMLEDEKTKNSKSEAEAQLEEYEKYLGERKEKQKVNLEKQSIETKKWYQFWK
ncbi:hypothetical protein [Robertmurraya siralis]|uniref:hypothetical protein n=1 Tax=Robertmurraya siralis TaxID=77777 RepID=UPI0010F6ABA8|nr:hypothetical protein [Robertmurraya siralis]